MKILEKRNIKVGKYNIFNFFLIILIIFISFSKNNDAKSVELKILDKVSSKSSKLKIEINSEVKFKNLKIKVLKCENSKFDDNPEVTAYLQVIDTESKNNDKVFVFNGWTFASSPTLQSIDHPIYDLWITGCENI